MVKFRVKFRVDEASSTPTMPAALNLMRAMPDIGAQSVQTKFYFTFGRLHVK